MMNICICGGGSLGHVCAGVLASHPGVSVRIHSRQPERWADTLRIADPAGKTYVGRLATVTADYARAVADCQMVFLCLPGYAIAPTLQALSPHLPAGCSVGAIVGSTGFFFHAHQLLPADTPLFAFQRTPFIARTDSYGQSALLLGYKPAVELAAERFPDVEAFRAQVEQLFVTPTRLLNNFYEASLTNSNPILHTGRLYTMWANWDGTPYDRCTLFYKEWTDAASDCIIRMDEEFMRLLDHLPVDKSRIPTLLTYYESHDATSLTRKIASIPAFQPIKAPMKQTAQGTWVPDFGSRYFTEDFPCGLHFIQQLATRHAVDTPLIDQVLAWGLSKIQ